MIDGEKSSAADQQTMRCESGEIVVSSSASLNNMTCRRTNTEKFLAAAVAFAMQWIASRVPPEDSGHAATHASQQRMLDCNLPIAQAFIVSTALQLTADGFVRELCSEKRSSDASSLVSSPDDQHTGVWPDTVLQLLQRMVDMENSTTHTALNAHDLLVRCPYVSTAADSSFFQVVVELEDARATDVWGEVSYRARKPNRPRSAVFHVVYSVHGSEVCGVMVMSTDPSVHLYLVHASGTVGQMLLRFDSIDSCIAYMRDNIPDPSGHIVLARFDDGSLDDELRRVAHTVCTIASHFQQDEFEPAPALPPSV